MAEVSAWVCLKLATPLTKGILSEVPEGNLVPRAFPLKVGKAGKDPGIGWSRVYLTP